jgi:hypothetical protein
VCGFVGVWVWEGKAENGKLKAERLERKAEKLKG